LASLGPLPDEASAGEDLLQLEHPEDLVDGPSRPASDAEARLLLHCFGPDDCYGLARGLLHLIESAPGWPDRQALDQAVGEWPDRLRERLALDPPEATDYASTGASFVKDVSTSSIRRRVSRSVAPPSTPSSHQRRGPDRVNVMHVQRTA
jgi:hypothetical protein